MAHAMLFCFLASSISPIGFSSFANETAVCTVSDSLASLLGPLEADIREAQKIEINQILEKIKNPNVALTEDDLATLNQYILAFIKEIEPTDFLRNEESFKENFTSFKIIVAYLRNQHNKTPAVKNKDKIKGLLVNAQKLIPALTKHAEKIATEATEALSKATSTEEAQKIKNTYSERLTNFATLTELSTVSQITNLTELYKTKNSALERLAAEQKAKEDKAKEAALKKEFNERIAAIKRENSGSEMIAELEALREDARFNDLAGFERDLARQEREIQEDARRKIEREHQAAMKKAQTISQLERERDRMIEDLEAAGADEDQIAAARESFRDQAIRVGQRGGSQTVAAVQALIDLDADYVSDDDDGDLSSETIDGIKKIIALDKSKISDRNLVKISKALGELSGDDVAKLQVDVARKLHGQQNLNAAQDALKMAAESAEDQKYKDQIGRSVSSVGQQIDDLPYQRGFSGSPGLYQQWATDTQELANQYYRAQQEVQFACYSGNMMESCLEAQQRSQEASMEYQRHQQRAQMASQADQRLAAIRQQQFSVMNSGLSPSMGFNGTSMVNNPTGFSNTSPAFNSNGLNLPGFQNNLFQNTSPFQLNNPTGNTNTFMGAPIRTL